MQPYFIPYTGYFRLFTQADQFVILDDVQFPRRGWVHRNRLTSNNHQLNWLTLPLKKVSQETKINKMVFSKNALVQFNKQLPKFKIFQDDNNFNNSIVMKMFQFELPLVDYLEYLLKEICEQLNIQFNIVRSSKLGLNNTVTGNKRIIEIVKTVGASTYINSPGGKSLYYTEDFNCANIKLEFLPEWSGDYASILQRILTENTDNIRKEII